MICWRSGLKGDGEPADWRASWTSAGSTLRRDGVGAAGVEPEAENQRVTGSKDRRREGGVAEVIQAGRGTEHMARDARIDKKIRIGATTDGLAHRGQAESKLRRGQFELADQDTFRGWHVKPSVLATSRQSQSEIGDEKRFTGVRFADEHKAY